MLETDELFVIESPAWSLSSSGHPITTLDYSSDGSYAAFSGRPGEVTVISSYDGTAKISIREPRTQYALTGVKFWPGDDLKILASSRDGFIFMINISSGESTAFTRHLGSVLTGLAVDSFGDNFAISCADGSIRLYDAENMQRTKALIKMSGRPTSSQNVSIFSLMFHPENANFLLSATGNDRVLIWDLRSGLAERCIVGPHVKGQSMDMYDAQIITGSAREKKQIEVWDFGSAKKIRDINLDSARENHDLQIAALKIARNGLDLFAGGASITQVFEYKKGTVIGQSMQAAAPVSVIAASPFGASFINGYENGELACFMVRVRQH